MAKLAPYVRDHVKDERQVSAQCVHQAMLATPCPSQARRSLSLVVRSLRTLFKLTFPSGMAYASGSQRLGSFSVLVA